MAQVLKLAGILQAQVKQAKKAGNCFISVMPHIPFTGDSMQPSLDSAFGAFVRISNKGNDNGEDSQSSDSPDTSSPDISAPDVEEAPPAIPQDDNKLDKPHVTGDDTGEPAEQKEPDEADEQKGDDEAAEQKEADEAPEQKKRNHLYDPFAYPYYSQFYDRPWRKSGTARITLQQALIALYFCATFIWCGSVVS